MELISRKHVEHASPDLDLILEKYDGVPRERPRRWSQKIEVKRIEAGSYGQKTHFAGNPAGVHLHMVTMSWRTQKFLGPFQRRIWNAKGL